MRSKTFHLPLADFPPFSRFYRGGGVALTAAEEKDEDEDEEAGAAAAEARCRSSSVRVRGGLRVIRVQRERKGGDGITPSKETEENLRIPSKVLERTAAVPGEFEQGIYPLFFCVCFKMKSGLLFAIVATIVAILANVVPIYVYEGIPGVYPPPWPVYTFGLVLIDSFQALLDFITPPELQAVKLAQAYQDTEVVNSLARAGVFHVLHSAGDGKEFLSCPEIAKRLPSDVYAPFLCRLLEAAELLGAVKVKEVGAEKEKRFRITEVGKAFSGKGTTNGADWKDFLMVGRAEGIRESWHTGLPLALSTGRSGFMEATGSEMWEFFEPRPQVEGLFDRAMRSITLDCMRTALLDYKFGEFASMCDIGGGWGTALQKVLEANPSLQGTVFDRPSVVERSAAVLNQNNPELAKRVKWAAGSFLDGGGLPTDCDLYYMKMILHDWNDEDSVLILKHVADAMRKASGGASTRLILHESLTDTESRLMRKLVVVGTDIRMMAEQPPGARERSSTEFERLLEAAGMRMTRVVRLRGPLHIVEAALKENEQTSVE
uniref:O-methyltransferase C-terminal domain-containing protein n=1 Tax=Chromera velia CCMP2878 TaxID=1169474 RepID=A0A0G4HBA9_9ALVE|eukprot:Cvel_25925.t1-p1 / transcript=Cvel_25925.t1 / gene=Cvel_25925 / organism=Chromera_velia_CCMP2878 / gene_product=O-demethylpuromycin-O-methyltransferase, putative / transcript_product=O-demethylpuromycin-O-methyltransferase, putative / location=Cvel_scaffold2999:2285-11079(+) / protein_length=545 / sequence_SO=supercontig / SO=protein_coding / is_pseudo=false